MPATIANDPTPARAQPALPDVQKTVDRRGVVIEKVGVKQIRHPIRVRDATEGWQHTVATVNMYVDLPAHFKGTHMSRFLEVLNQHCGEVSIESIPDMLQLMLEKLDAQNAHVEMQFPYFMRKPAPVTGMAGMMEYTCGFQAQAGAEDVIVLNTLVPVATLCPCSKEIADRGAHNQRGHVTFRVWPTSMIWFEELIAIAERAGSCALYPVLKRPDEKFVTEYAYDHPRFVEDVLREAAVALREHDKVGRFEIEVENFESIHGHNAYACTSSDVAG